MSLVVDAVVKRFGAIVALDGLSFGVTEGETFGFLGANGAGKTTTMRIALGVVRADAGRITWRGQGSEELPRRTWGYLPEERGLYHRMLVVDQLVYFGQLYGLTAERARREARAWLARFRIADLGDRRAEELSKGNQQKVQLIAAVLHDPDVLLMDEPFTGLDPVNVTLLRESFLDLRREGKTLVFSTHQMETVETLCESVAIIDRGRLVVAGPLREVKRSTGRLAVRIGFETATETGWLDEVRGGRVGRRGTDEAELALEPSADPDEVLVAALARHLSVRRFEVLEPSLEQVFLERVGRAAEAEALPVPEPPAMGRTPSEAPPSGQARAVEAPTPAGAPR
ncbi:MAG TPA: ATP-binding cassette domain-containing protein [Candidatus Dormibacteraeota bacterium]|nr:ATP-binding cassette domain-containing protein [Candidatus Dormibacteraeota bacterium]